MNGKHDSTDDREPDQAPVDRVTRMHPALGLIRLTARAFGTPEM